MFTDFQAGGVDIGRLASGEDYQRSGCDPRNNRLPTLLHRHTVVDSHERMLDALSRAHFDKRSSHQIC